MLCNPMIRLLFCLDESMKMRMAYSNKGRSGSQLLSMAADKSKNITPTVNTIGSMCTSFRLSGYFLKRLILAIPLL